MSIGHGELIHLDDNDWCDEWIYLGTAIDRGDGRTRHIVAQRYTDGSWYATTVSDVDEKIWHRAKPWCHLNGPYYEETPYGDA